LEVIFVVVAVVVVVVVVDLHCSELPAEGTVKNVSQTKFTHTKKSYKILIKQLSIGRYIEVYIICIYVFIF